MTGKLVFEDQIVPIEEYKHLRAYFTLENGQRILFIDIRTFGKITLCKTQNLDLFIARLGPEPLTKNFDATYLSQALQNRKSPIKNALLDQRIVAGLGNIYVCEILYRAGIRPETRANIIPLFKLKKIVVHTKDVLLEALAHNGTSISDFRRVDDKSGEFQNFLRVYQKKFCPQGHEISRVKLAGRSSFYCTKCQK
jgi:formamidopyrimidine-DNA glycosylase